jgi:ribosome-associated protein
VTPIEEKERPTIEKKTSLSPVEQNGRAREMAIALARVAADTRCTNVVLLDVSHISPITDFFILGTGTSPRQMRTVCDECTETAQTAGFGTLSTSGYESSSWICVDFVDIVLHIFSDEARAFYDLDNLWADARRIEWQAQM